MRIPGRPRTDADLADDAVLVSSPSAQTAACSARPAGPRCLVVGMGTWKYFPLVEAVLGHALTRISMPSSKLPVRLVLRVAHAGRSAAALLTPASNASGSRGRRPRRRLGELIQDGQVFRHADRIRDGHHNGHGHHQDVLVRATKSAKSRIGPPDSLPSVWK
jgi:hypothetical protein